MGKYFIAKVIELNFFWKMFRIENNITLSIIWKVVNKLQEKILENTAKFKDLGLSQFS